MGPVCWRLAQAEDRTRSEAASIPTPVGTANALRSKKGVFVGMAGMLDVFSSVVNPRLLSSPARAGRGFQVLMHLIPDHFSSRPSAWMMPGRGA